MAEYSEQVAGVWSPAIPLPMFGVRKACGCGRRFWTVEGYRGHYALRHWPLDLRDAAVALGSGGEGDPK